MRQRTRLEKVKLYEDKLLEAQTVPVRNYLLEHVMPTLTQGLVKCCQSQLQDPVDFLVVVFHLLIPVDLCSPHFNLFFSHFRLSTC